MTRAEINFPATKALRTVAYKGTNGAHRSVAIVPILPRGIAHVFVELMIDMETQECCGMMVSVLYLTPYPSEHRDTWGDSACMIATESGRAASPSRNAVQCMEPKRSPVFDKPGHLRHGPCVLRVIDNSGPTLKSFLFLPCFGEHMQRPKKDLSEN